MGDYRHRLGHRLAVRPRAHDAALAPAAARLGMAGSLRLRAARRPGRALYPLAHLRDRRLSRGRKAADDADRRPAAPPPGLVAAGARRLHRFERLVLPAALHPDLWGEDAASARLH